MIYLNLPCRACKTGRLIVKDYINDDYKIGCTNCDDRTAIHYTSFNILMSADEYLSQLNRDVIILNENGTWQRNSRKLKRESDFKKFVQNMKLIHMIKSHEITYFYQDRTNFIMIDYNDIHKNYTIYDYVANDKGLPRLMHHFFNIPLESVVNI